MNRQLAFSTGRPSLSTAVMVTNIAPKVSLLVETLASPKDRLQASAMIRAYQGNGVQCRADRNRQLDIIVKALIPRLTSLKNSSTAGALEHTRTSVI